MEQASRPRSMMMTKLRVVGLHLLRRLVYHSWPLPKYVFYLGGGLASFCTVSAISSHLSRLRASDYRQQDRRGVFR